MPAASSLVVIAAMVPAMLPASLWAGITTERVRSATSANLGWRRDRGGWPSSGPGRSTTDSYPRIDGAATPRRHDPGRAGLLPVQGQGRPGDLRRQGEVAAVAPQQLLREGVLA